MYVFTYIPDFGSGKFLVLAYLDPGAGSYFFQLVIAGLLGGLFAVKLFWKSIIAFFASLWGGVKKYKEK